MIRWEKYLYSIRDYLVLFSLLVFSYLLILHNDEPQIQWIRSKVLQIVGFWENSLNGLYQYRTLKAENEILRQRLALLSYDNTLYKEAFLENDRLRKLLNFKRKSRFDLIPVSIIRQNYQGFSHSFFLDVGTRDGVKVNMPVVSSEGLIGRVVIASTTSSVAQVLDDINFRVSGIVQRSRIAGIVRPDKEFDLIFDYVPVLADVVVGDVIITSGYSDIYPKGIEIGMITRIKVPEHGLFKVIHITPSVDLSNVEEAFVIRN